MKKLAVFLILLQTTILYAAKPKPNPADFPITIHVVSSRQRAGQELKTIIDGREISLLAGGSIGVLALGDYRAQLVKGYGPKNPNPSDVFRGYRLPLTDGSTRDFEVIGLGPTVDGNAPLSPNVPTHP